MLLLYPTKARVPVRYLNRLKTPKRMLPVMLSLLIGQGLTAPVALAQTGKNFSPVKAVKVAVTPDTTVYTYVEQMPELSDGDGMGSLAGYIGRYTLIPSFCGQFPESSRIVVEFTVNETGDISDARVSRSITSRVDSAVLMAISSLPCLRPGRRNGLPVKVRLAIAIVFDWQ